VADAALELFVRQYGAVSGNVSLTAYATGGVYLAGGIAPKILPKLQQGGFMKAFNEKGRLSSVTRRVPVYVVLNEEAPLFGAAHYAARSLA
jgi:glucokinase